MPSSNRALKTINDAVLIHGDLVDLGNDLYFSVEDQTIIDVGGRIYAVEVPGAFQPFVFGLAVEVAIQRYNDSAVAFSMKGQFIRRLELTISPYSTNRWGTKPSNGYRRCTGIAKAQEQCRAAAKADVGFRS